MNSDSEYQDEDSRASFVKRPLTDEDDNEDDLGIQKKLPKRRKTLKEDLQDSESEEDLPSVKFREGGGLPSDQSDEGNSDDEEDLGEFGDILERELMK